MTTQRSISATIPARPTRHRDGQSLLTQLLFTVVALSVVALTGACGDATESDVPAAAASPAVSAADSGRVTLSAAAFATARIEVIEAQAEGTPALADAAMLEVPGQVELDPRRVAVISARVGGRLEALFKVEGDPVQKGEVVASVFSADYLTAQSDLAQSARRATQLAGTADSVGARALAMAAARRVALFGAVASEIEALERGAEPTTTLQLRAPMTGRITKAHQIVGTAVEAGGPIYTVADLTELDVVAEVPEISMPLVRVNGRAEITIVAFPGMRFTGRVERLRDALNPDTRTVQAVIHLSNASGALRPGMYATVRLSPPDGAARRPASGSAAARSGALVPESAIVNDGTRQLIFVEVGERTFERRYVRVEPLTPVGSMRPIGRMVRVVDGLRAGERVVVTGAFLLKSELTKSSFGEDE